MSESALSEARADRPQPRVLLYARVWFPSSARLAIALLRHGCKVVALCPVRHPLRHVNGLEAIYPYTGIESVSPIRNAILASEPTLIVPCDDGAVWHLHDLYGRDPGLRSLIERSLGASEGFPAIRSRGLLLEVAASLGIRVPETKVVSSEQDLHGWVENKTAVLKLDGTCGGTGVAIVHSRAEAAAELRQLMGVHQNGYAMGVTVQRFIKGRPANTMFACWDGAVLGIVTVEVIASRGATGAAIVVRVVRHEEIERAAHLLAGRLKLNGFYGLDFVLEDGTGAAYLIELNPRLTQLGHLRIAGKGDLAGFISAKLWDRPVPPASDTIQEETIAFFPQAMKTDRKGIYMSSAYHDLPLEEPGLYRELLRDTWPERTWLSRIYHTLRLPKRRKMVRWL